MSPPLLLGLSAALHLYIGARLIPPLSGTVLPAVVAVMLVCSAVLVPLGMFARRIVRPPRGDALAGAGLFFLGLFSSLLVSTFLRDVLLLLWSAVAALAPGAMAPGELARLSAPVALWLAVLATLLGFLNARRTARVKHVRVPVSGLPAGLEGFTIVQISDIHVGPTSRGPYGQGIVEAVTRLQPDVVAITGDLVDGSVADLGQHVAPLSGLVARHGSYFVTGNHEYYSGALPWIAELGRLGIRVLHNEHVVIHRSGEKLVLAGVPDYSAGHFHADHRSDPGAAIAGAPADAGVKVLLAHQPRSAPAAAQAGFDVQISGHTHGGQFWPWIHFVRFQQPFTAGLHRLDALSVYVSRGTGYWGPPKRFGAPSEITRLMLVAA